MSHTEMYYFNDLKKVLKLFYVFQSYSIDLVDSTFGVMNIDSEPCRKRTICEMERVATKYPIVSFIVKTVR